jgi:hypothetical protein
MKSRSETTIYIISAHTHGLLSCLELGLSGKQLMTCRGMAQYNENPLHKTLAFPLSHVPAFASLSCIKTSKVVS